MAEPLQLEVLEVNRAAQALYESFGFERVRRLLGFECPTPVATARSPDFAEIELAELASRAYAWQEPHLPWQSDAATLANLSPPARAFALGDRAAAVVIGATEGPLVLRALLVRPDLRRRGHGSTLWAELVAHHPGRSWRTSFALPEGLMDAFFHAHGFKTAALAQWEMIYSS